MKAARPKHLCRRVAPVLCAVASLGGAIETSTVAAKPDEHLTVRRTSHGVVHVTAGSYRGIGYGVGYAYTEDNQCLLAYRIAEVNGNLAAQLGADAPVRNEVHDLTYTALQSDQYYRGWFDIGAIRAGFAGGAREVRDLAEGYAAGVNRWLSGRRASRSCAVQLDRKVTVDDIYRIWVAAATVASGDLVAGLLPQQAPVLTPASAAPASLQLPRPGTTDSITTLRKTAAGSNAWALGRDVVRGNKSVHFYNPHFPWTGIHRLYLIHATIPGELDVMGAALGGFPLPVAGFTRDVAWGLTFSNAARWSLADLELAGDPMTYKQDGVTKTIGTEMLSIPVRGETAPRQVPFFRAGKDPIIDADSLFFGWWDDPANPGRAYAAHDVNADNTRMVEQSLRLAQAGSVREVQKRLETVQGVPWSYVVASDASGEVFFGDVSALPGLTTADISNCVVSAIGAFYLDEGIVVLDGTRSACAWQQRLPAASQPRSLRSDYVANSNNTYELPNVAERLQGYSPIFGVAGEGLSLRASLGLRMIDDRITGVDGLGKPGFTLENVKQVFYQTRNLGAELLVPGIVADCRANPLGEYDGTVVDLTGVCNALAGWDQRNTVQSRGAVVFRGLWMALDDAFVDKPSLFETAAAIDDPLHTPAGYSSNPNIRSAVRNALARVATALAADGIAPDASWGQVNKVRLPDQTLPLPGGTSNEGLFDDLLSSTAFYTFDGWRSTLRAGNDPGRLFGTNYVQVVGLGPKAPQAAGFLAYGQASEPGSPWYLSQVHNLSTGTWISFPFTEDQIQRDPKLRVLRLSM